jgi:hypothetical protein
MSFPTLGPKTPSGKSHNDINRYLQQLAEVGFPVAPCDASYSPAASSPGQNYQIVNLIRYIYFQQLKAADADHIDILIKDIKGVPVELRTNDYLKGRLHEVKTKHFPNAMSPYKQAPLAEQGAEGSENVSFVSKLRQGNIIVSSILQPLTRPQEVNAHLESTHLNKKTMMDPTTIIRQLRDHPHHHADQYPLLEEVVHLQSSSGRPLV